MKFMNKNGGFTLVELIVVIAILAILAGVAVPAYSGYVEKANMQADISLANEVANALTLRYYGSHAQEKSMVMTVMLSNGGASADGEAAAAMEAVFGSTWRNDAKLKYDKWGSGAAVTKNVVNHFSSAGGSLAGIYNGTQKPSFAADVKDLYAEVEDTAVLWGGVANYGTGANLMKDVASATLGYTSSDASVSNEDAFAAAWATNGAWADVNFSEEGQTKVNAGANYAVIKARNTAVGTYLKNTYGYSDEVVDAFMNVAGTIVAAGTESTSDSDDTYWNEMSGAIGIYASIASGDADLTELQNHFGSMTVSAGSAAVTLIVSNGVPSIQTSPAALTVGN